MLALHAAVSAIQNNLRRARLRQERSHFPVMRLILQFMWAQDAERVAMMALNQGLDIE